MAVFPASYKTQLPELRHSAREPMSCTVEPLRAENYLKGIQLNSLSDSVSPVLDLLNQ